ncbi:FAD-binding protein [Bacillus testis]|uniref:FAD-binding protein n=1 Tax=Bacillus testis TaxID=1622072 RepID=UPI00067F3502|nr:FAD-binding protein [Bacillus testis]
MPAKKPTQWDQEVDVVVMGTGGAALVAAITAHDQGAKVLIIEKTHQIGGTTAFSGGVPWIPMNRYMKEEGIEDTREDALKYIRRITGGKEPNPELIEVYVDNAYKVIDYLYENTPVRFMIPKSYPEYYSFFDGAKAGRSLDPLPFDLNQIGEYGALIRNNPAFPPLTLEEGGANGSVDFMKIAERMENNIVTMGRSLTAALVKACLDREINILLETPGKELVLNDEGDVIGLVAEQKGEKVYIGVSNGVVLASGGFEWNKELVKTFLKGEITHPLSPGGNEGDGLIMAMEAGAALGNMSEAWWYPAMQDPTFEYEDRVLNQLGNGGRMGPHSIIVNGKAKRFVHEGTAYNDMPKAFYEFDPVNVEWPNEKNNWMIFDQQMKDYTMIITMMPGEDAPEWVNQSDTIKGLAEQIGLDPEALEATVERWNAQVEAGEDTDFHRGTTFFEGLQFGGGNVELNLGKIEKGPYYAVPVYFGALGTNGGPRIDENGQVLNLRGNKIKGLYAAGNAAMGIFGPAYLSAGGTIGPAITFGYLAGKAVGQVKNHLIGAE